MQWFKHAFERIILYIILQLELSFPDQGLLMLMRKIGTGEIRSD